MSVPGDVLVLLLAIFNTSGLLCSVAMMDGCLETPSWEATIVKSEEAKPVTSPGTLVAPVTVQSYPQHVVVKVFPTDDNVDVDVV